MTTSKKMRRPALVGSGRRLSREEVEDLLRYFAGDRDGQGWALLLPELVEHCLLECWRRWSEYAAEHPGAELPRLLAERMLERWEHHRAEHPDAVPPADLEAVRAAAGLSASGAQR